MVLQIQDDDDDRWMLFLYPYGVCSQRDTIHVWPTGSNVSLLFFPYYLRLQNSN